MFDVLLVVHARAGDRFGMASWLPALPSFQFPYVEWGSGVRETVAAVAFPPNAPIEITVRAEVLDADRATYLDHGWRVLPEAPPTSVRPTDYDALDTGKGVPIHEDTV